MFDLAGRVALVTLIRTLTTFLCVSVAAFSDGSLWTFAAAYIVGGFAELVAAVSVTPAVISELRLRIQIARLLPLLKEAIPFVTIGLGYAAEQKQSIPKNDLDSAKIHINTYLS